MEKGALFSKLDLFIINELLNKKSICLRDLTTKKNTTNNDIFQRKLNNLVKLGLIEKEAPRGKRIGYAIKNRKELKSLREILNESNKFYISIKKPRA